MFKTRAEKKAAQDKAKGEPALFWATVKIYQPFIFGGNVWQFNRYPVIGYATSIDGRDGFVWRRKGRYLLHDAFTGCYICDGADILAAVKRATQLLRLTPDFAKQAEHIGSATNFPLIEYDEAMRLLDKNKEDDIKREKEFDRLIAKEKANASGNAKGRNKGRSARARRVEQKDR